MSAGRIKILNANEDERVGWRAYTNRRLINGTRFHNKDKTGSCRNGKDNETKGVYITRRKWNRQVGKRGYEAASIYKPQIRVYT